MSVKVLVCEENSLKCVNGQCVSFDLVCNGVNNCGDYSDELLSECVTSQGQLSAASLEVKDNAARYRCKRPVGQLLMPNNDIPRFSQVLMFIKARK